MLADDRETLAIEAVQNNKAMPGLQLETWINKVLQGMPDLKGQWTHLSFGNLKPL